MITLITTHFPDRGERQTLQQPWTPTCGKSDRNPGDEQQASEKTRNSLCSRSVTISQTMTVSGKGTDIFAVCHFFYLKIALMCECMHALPATSLKQPHHRLKEMSPLSSSRGLLTIPIYFSLNTSIHLNKDTVSVTLSSCSDLGEIQGKF